MKSILITAPFGLTFKNLFSTPDFVKRLHERGVKEIHILTPFTNDEAEKMLHPDVKPLVTLQSLPLQAETRAQSLASLASATAFNKLIKSGTDQIKSQAYRPPISLRFFLILVRATMTFFGPKSVYLFAEKAKYLLYRNDAVASILSRLNPQLIFTTAPSFHPDFRIISEATRQQLPIVGMVHSWDNLSSKGAISRSFTRVVVWNHFQKEEILQYYPYTSDQVVEVGMPQLDSLAVARTRISKENLYHKLKLDPDTKLITYTTGTPKTIPTEPNIVERIHETMSGLPFRWQLLVRLHPKAHLKDYEHLRSLSNITLETVSNESIYGRDGQSFTTNDLLHYAEILEYSSAIINVASTVTIESALFDTPVINVAFDEVDSKDYFHSVRRFYDYDHMKFLGKFNAAPVVKTPDELLKTIKLFEQSPDRLQQERKAMLESLSTYTDGKNCLRIADCLLTIDANE